MIAVDLASVDAAPCYDAVSHLVHAVGRDAVTDVWVGGERVVADRRLLTRRHRRARGARTALAGTHAMNASTTSTKPAAATNPDPHEVEKFAALAHHWWDPESEFGPLHRINPLRLGWIDRVCGGLAGKPVVDVGCGGGILSEAMAERGASVTGIDLGEKALGVARLHKLEIGAAVDYRLVSAEALAARDAGARSTS